MGVAQVRWWRNGLWRSLDVVQCGAWSVLVALGGVGAPGFGLVALVEACLLARGCMGTLLGGRGVGG